MQQHFRAGEIIEIPNDQIGIPQLFYQNIYIALDGTIRPRKFPTSGLWTFDGQFYIPPKRRSYATAL